MGIIMAMITILKYIVIIRMIIWQAITYRKDEDGTGEKRSSNPAF